MKKESKDLNKVDLFEYLDFREYLRNKFNALKQAQRGFSTRSLAKKAGLKGHSYLRMIINGKRRLTYEVMQKFCRALKITGREKKYFETLVAYNQEENPEVKSDYLKQLTRIRPRIQRYLLQENQHKYLSQTHYVCIREMVGMKDFQEDEHWIANRLLPPITPMRVQEAIGTLLQLNMLKKNQEGKLARSDAYIDTWDKNTPIKTSYIFHDTILHKARFALAHIPQPERSYYALTLLLSKKAFQRVSDQFYHLMDKVVDDEEGILDREEGSQEVYQLNFQIFPLTRKKN